MQRRNPLEGHRLSGGSCIEEYLNSRDSSQLYNKVLIHGYLRLAFYGILIALALFVIGTYIFFFTSYQELSEWKRCSQFEYLPSARGTVAGASKTTVYKNTSCQSLPKIKVNTDLLCPLKTVISILNL